MISKSILNCITPPHIGLRKTVNLMGFFNRIHCKYTGIKGFLTVYNDALRYWYMITEKAKGKTGILVFLEKHGFGAARSAVLNTPESEP